MSSEWVLGFSFVSMKIINLNKLQPHYIQMVFNKAAIHWCEQRFNDLNVNKKLKGILWIGFVGDFSKEETTIEL